MKPQPPTHAGPLTPTSQPSSPKKIKNKMKKPPRKSNQLTAFAQHTIARAHLVSPPSQQPQQACPPCLPWPPLPPPCRCVFEPPRTHERTGIHVHVTRNMAHPILYPPRKRPALFGERAHVRHQPGYTARHSLRFAVTHPEPPSCALQSPSFTGSLRRPLRQGRQGSPRRRAQRGDGARDDRRCRCAKAQAQAQAQVRQEEHHRAGRRHRHRQRIPRQSGARPTARAQSR